MSTLWTPSGEQPVGRTAPESATTGHVDEPGATGGTIDEAAYREELAKLEKELLAAPVGDVIANHCYGIFQLAALHLGQQPPNLEPARAAIDALGAVVEVLGDRLGEATASLHEGLAQIRMAFVQISAAEGSSATEPSAQD